MRRHPTAVRAVIKGIFTGDENREEWFGAIVADSLGGGGGGDRPHSLRLSVCFRLCKLIM